LKISEANWTI